MPPLENGKVGFQLFQAAAVMSAFTNLHGDSHQHR
jgi:hypothetical protein